MNGVLIIDKPSGFTSHDVVARVRRILGQRAVGHLGTLDPLATGVLPLVLGNMTRLAQFYLASEKSYEGVIRFGFATDTYDAEGEPVGEAQELVLKIEQVRAMSGKFLGKKVNGVPSYKLARRKKDVPLKAVSVEVKQFDISKLEDSRAHFAARVASGTYLRSIAQEMGQLAGCGAHLESLRRTAVAEFQLDDAHTLAELEQAALGGEAAGGEVNLDAIVVHPRKLLPALPSVTADDEAASKIRHGMAVNLPDFSRALEVKVFSGQRDLIAIATRVAGTLFHPKIVLV